MARNTGLTREIMTALESEPDRQWRPVEVAEAIDHPTQPVAATLIYLARRDRVHRHYIWREKRSTYPAQRKEPA